MNSLFCDENMFDNCLNSLSSKFNTEISLNMLYDEDAVKKLHELVTVCLNPLETTMLKGFSYVPFCSRLNLKVVKDFNGNIDFCIIILDPF